MFMTSAQCASQREEGVVQSRLNGVFAARQILGDLRRRRALVVRAAKDGAVSGGQLCQSFADLQPAQRNIHHKRRSGNQRLTAF
jgi:hypothetical protein